MSSVSNASNASIASSANKSDSVPKDAKGGYPVGAEKVGWRVTLLKISGTDPVKEAYVLTRECDTNLLGLLKLFLAKVRSEIQEKVDDGLRESKMKKWYADLWSKWDNFKTIPQFEAGIEYELPNGYVKVEYSQQSVPKGKERCYCCFNEPPDATLVAVDHCSSYDFHYYLQIDPKSSLDDLDWVTIHDH
jgi:hypothetical protein